MATSTSVSTKKNEKKENKEGSKKREKVATARQIHTLRNGGRHRGEYVHRPMVKDMVPATQAGRQAAPLEITMREDYDGS